MNSQCSWKESFSTISRLFKINLENKESKLKQSFTCKREKSFMSRNWIVNSQVMWCGTTR